ncbi:hypothetical protein COX58_02710, partial [archaeon CG_4_10_14_0_2_um_filter_Archaea_38_6]
ADIIGEDNVSATAEIINLSINLLKNLGLTNKDFTIRINSRKILDALINRLGVSDKARFYLLLDKKGKMEEKEFEKELKTLSKEYKILKELFTLNTNELLKKFMELGLDTDRLTGLFRLIDKKYAVMDLSIVRGLAYYTDIVFEAFDTKNELRSILGGGEYNNLIKDFGGEETPAVGLGMGDAVLLELLKSQKKLPIFENTTVFIATIGSVLKDAVKLREQLISKGCNVNMNLTDKNLSKQLSYAQNKGYPKVYILGEKDLKKGIITVKDMKKGTEKKIKG